MVERLLGSLIMNDSTSSIASRGLEGDRSALTFAPEAIRVLQGQYVASEMSSKGRLKWLHLNCNGTEVAVKLPKLIGYSLTKALQPNMTLQVWGRPQENYLKALMVVPVQSATSLEPHFLTNASFTQTVPELVATPATQPVTQPTTASAAISANASSRHSPTCTLKVCTKGKCDKQGGRQILQALAEAIRQQHLSHRVNIEVTGCLKNCKRGPTVKVNPEGVQYSFVQAKDVPRIVHRHVENPR